MFAWLQISMKEFSRAVSELSLDLSRLQSLGSAGECCSHKEPTKDDSVRVANTEEVEASPTQYTPYTPYKGTDSGKTSTAPPTRPPIDSMKVEIVEAEPDSVKAAATRGCCGGTCKGGCVLQ